MRPLRNTESVLNNRAVEQLLDVEREKGSTVTIDDIRIYVGGVYPRVMMDGETEAGVWSCGMVAGLIDGIPTVVELNDRIRVSADAHVRGRLDRLDWRGEVHGKRVSVRVMSGGSAAIERKTMSYI